MKKICIVSVMILASFLIFQSSEYILESQEDGKIEDCHKTFVNFAYNGPSQRTDDFFLPSLPWQIKTPIPNAVANPNVIFDVKLARNVDNNPEIWVSKKNTQLDATNLFLRYEPNFDRWEEISAFVETSGASVKELFSAEDGTLWGIMDVRRNFSQNNGTIIPAISIFNIEKRQFDFVEHFSVELDHNESITDITGDITGIMDYEDRLWLFDSNGNMLWFDTRLKSVKIFQNFVAGKVTYLALANDNSIYATVSNIDSVYQSQLIHITPEEFSYETVITPELRTQMFEMIEFPSYSGLLFDRTGNLWLGSVGFRRLNDDWNIIYPPYIDTYQQYLGEYLWATPKILMESSNGWLWFNKFLDTNGWGEGLAWFDPSLGEGCLLTNFVTSIIEDSNQTLWIVADGKLYNYDLNP